MQKTTIGSQLEKNRGIGPGFDFLRVFLAFSVVVTHTFVVLGQEYNQIPFLWFAAYWVLAIFFSLSGFLIAGSALRLKLRDFLINRGLRIVPALAVEILLAALILGPIFTTLPLHEYFQDPQFFHYMTNIFGWVNYDLPGVFKDHYSTRVNTSLWTVPYEFGCYAIMSALIYYGLLKKPSWIIASAAFIICAGVIISIGKSFGIEIRSISYTIGLIVDIFFYDRGSRLFVSFLLGIAAYLYRDKIPYNTKLFWTCVAYCVCISGIDPSWMEKFAGTAEMNFPFLNLFTAVPLTYIMVFIGVTDMPKLPLFHRGDYSYGIYLYGFPVQQALVAILPTKNLLIHFTSEAVLITIFAIFSWHFIEKPILQLRKKFSFIARQRLELEN